MVGRVRGVFRGRNHCVKPLLLVLMLGLLLGRRVESALLLDEPFRYTNGPLLIVSADAWAHHSGTTSNQVDVTGEKVNLTSGETEDVNRSLLGQPYLSTGTTNIFYARFTVRFTGLPGADGTWFASFKSSGPSTFRCRVFALTTGAAGEKFRLGLATANNSNATITNETDLSLNTTYNVVVKLVNTSSAATLWLNPSTAADASIATSETSSTFTVTSFALRQDTDLGTLEFDNLVVATSFAEVLAGSPAGAPFITRHPESQAAAEGSGATLLASAIGPAPLAYQWLFNNQPVLAATNDTLTLTNLAPAQQGLYALRVTNASGSATSAPALLAVLAAPPAPSSNSLRLFDYNTHGNMVGDWTTNSPQVQAIGRQVMFLDPDIITFQEIPLTNSGWTQMPHFVTAFRPGFYLAINSGTDGFIRSAILSRYPITRSSNQIDGASLTNFGYDGKFTRDLFEAEIAVPGWAQPLHVFTTHLKSGQDSDSTLRRAAETRAITNFFISTFRPAKPLRPYLLTGDFNEDVSAPPAGGVALSVLTSPGTGLQLITPLNPVNGSSLTFSIQAASLTRRYDYCLPGPLLTSNVTSSQVFRTDLATNIAPALPGDDVTASDHLPLFVTFANPFAAPVRIGRVAATNGALFLQWNTVAGGRYRVEACTHFPAWTAFATNLLATNGTLSLLTNAPAAPRFYRVRTEP